MIDGKKRYLARLLVGYRRYECASYIRKEVVCFFFRRHR